MNKRGDVTSTQIVAIVLAVAVLIVLAIFLAAFSDQGALLDEQSCRLSVLKRATLLAGESLTPLDCTTQKVCITSKSFGGKCNQFAGEENIFNVKIDLSKPDEAKAILEEQTANAMYTCWSMMGQGKIDVLTKDSFVGQASGWFGLSGVTSFNVAAPQCVVCSRLAISQDVLEDARWNNVRNQVDINAYMLRHSAPGSNKNYISALTGLDINNYEGIDQKDLSIFDFGNSDVKEKFSASENSQQLAIIFMQIKTNIDPARAAEDVALGAFVVGAGGLIGSSGVPIVGKVVGGALKNPYVLVLLALGVAGTSGYAAYQAHNSQIVSAGLCKDFKEGDDAKVGCSFVKAIDWDKTDVRELCYGGIEGYL